MTPKFIYFDLGNVLLNFDHQLACRQLAGVSGAPAERIYEQLFKSDLQRRYECGEISTEQVYEEFCRRLEVQPTLKEFCRAGSEIFQINVSMKAVIAQLKRTGWRLGLLSNTCEMHWNYYTSGRYALIPDAFDAVAVSFRIGAMKPDATIFQAAAELAGVEPNEIFYTDDLPQHVAAARAVGFDAEQFTGTPALVRALRARGVRFNY